MKTFALALTAGAVSAISNMELKYMQYAAQWSKHHESIEEFMTRLEHFIEADRNIEESNASETSFTLAHNKFSDWSKDEYKQLLGYKPEMHMPRNYTYHDESNADEYVDWKAKGAVTPVKD